jgi:microcystin-dependent protein
MTNRDYSGGARALVLATALGPTATTFEVEQVFGTWPLGSADGSLPFFIVLSRGTPQEEKVLVRFRAGTTFTVQPGGRGADDTSAQSHNAGAVVEHVWTATDGRESNRHVNADRGVHGLTANDRVIGEAELSANILAERLARIADVDAEQAAREAAILAEQAARSDADSAIIASIAQSAPVGAMFMWPADNAPSGWFLCRGQSIARATYPELFALIGTDYGSVDGASFNLPNLTSRMPRGRAASEAAGLTGGAASVDLTDAMVPLRSHSHAINHDHPSVNTNTTGAHTHGVKTNSNNGQLGNGASGWTYLRDVNDNVGGVTTTNMSSAGNHAHTVNVPVFSGNSTAQAAAASTPVPTVPPFMVINFIIKNRP